MNPNTTQSLVWDHIRESRQRARVTIARFGRRVAAVLAECNYAQRRMTVLKTNPDAYLPGGGQAPDNYAEFLFRTSGALLREPTAGHRADGQLVG
jgi:hypothetical protein